MRPPVPTSPTDPWLFYRAPPDWRWISFGEAAGTVEEGARRLAGVAGGARVAVPYRPHPRALLADLAVQRAGWIAVPLPLAPSGDLAEAAAAKRCVAWLDGPWCDAPAPEGLVRLRLDGGVAPSASPEAAVRAGPPGGAVAIDPLGREWMGSHGEIDRLARLLPIGHGARREVLVHWRPLQDLAERLLTCWSRLVGAALAVEPSAERLAETVHWCRPTVLQGTAAELEALADRLLPSRDRKARAAFRRRFRRLRTLLVIGAAPLAADSAWRELDASIGAFEGLGELAPGASVSG